jgi:hypothetical protein
MSFFRVPSLLRWLHSCLSPLVSGPADGSSGHSRRREQVVLPQLRSTPGEGVLSKCSRSFIYISFVLGAIRIRHRCRHRRCYLHSFTMFRVAHRWSFNFLKTSALSSSSVSCWKVISAIVQQYDLAVGSNPRGHYVDTSLIKAPRLK